MGEKELKAEIVKSGTWLYDSQVSYEVWIVKQNFDFYHDEGFEDQPENLNSDGEVYQVLFACEQGVKSVGLSFLHLSEAITYAEEKIPQGISWSNHRLQSLFNGRYYSLSA